MFWWRGTWGQPAASVWIGVGSGDIATVCPAAEGSDGSAEFRAVMNRACGVNGEIVAEYPEGGEYESWRLATSAIGELEVYLVVSRSQTSEAAHTGATALMDVELPLTLRFGTTQMPLQELAGLAVGSVIEFDGALSDPVELLINGRVIARGDAVVLQGCYALRIAEIASPRERLFSAEFKSNSYSEAAVNQA
jgi:flagellar motor switch protein FliN